MTSDLRTLAHHVEQQGQGENPVLNDAAAALRKCARDRARLLRALHHVDALVDDVVVKDGKEYFSIKTGTDLHKAIIVVRATLKEVA